MNGLLQPAAALLKRLAAIRLVLGVVLYTVIPIDHGVYEQSLCTRMVLLCAILGDVGCIYIDV